MSFSWKTRMSRIPYFKAAIRAGPIPKANPVKRSGSYPTFSRTAGSTIPAPMISSQSVSSVDPSGRVMSRFTSTSADGSVKGKKEGRNLTCVPGPQKSLANSARVALKSTKVIPSSTTRPSS